MKEIESRSESEEKKDSPTTRAGYIKLVAGTNETQTKLIVEEALEKGIEIPPELSEELDKAFEVLHQTSERLSEIRRKLNQTEQSG